jgi:hypothetical protein
MGLVFDPVSYAVDKFMTRRGQVEVDAAIRTSLGLSERMEIFGLEARLRNREAPTVTLDRVHSLVVDICFRNSFGRLLLVFRKLPHELIMSFLQRRYSISSQHFHRSFARSARRFAQTVSEQEPPFQAVPKRRPQEWFPGASLPL